MNNYLIHYVKHAESAFSKEMLIMFMGKISVFSEERINTFRIKTLSIYY